MIVLVSQIYGIKLSLLGINHWAVSDHCLGSETSSKQTKLFLFFFLFFFGVNHIWRVLDPSDRLMAISIMAFFMYFLEISPLCSLKSFPAKLKNHSS